jgi:uncharacterized protein
MIRTAIPLTLAASAAIAGPATAADIQVAAQGPLVELSVTETVKGKPDVADVGAGVTTDAPTAVEAMRLNAQAMDSVIAKIRALGVDPDDIQTTGINLGAQYDYDQQRQRQVFRGYRASNRVNVTLRDIKRVGPVLDALVVAGATDLSGPDFSIDDDEPQRSQARKAAFDKARAQAVQYAQWGGYTGVRLLSVSEAVNPGRPIPMDGMVRAQAMEAKATPIEPGLVGTAVTVNVTYEMTR